MQMTRGWIEEGGEFVSEAKANLSASIGRLKNDMYNLKGKSTLAKRDVESILLWERHRKGMPLDPDDYEVLSNYITKFDKTKIWHEAFDKMESMTKEYYISLLRKGESLTKPPRINISTIHGSKGGEADNVVLVTDMAASTWEASNLMPDSEHRVWYVGATRTKHSLNIVMPRGRYYYQL
jgi:superfamily I DNA/RNA helicase